MTKDEISRSVCAAMEAAGTPISLAASGEAVDATLFNLRQALAEEGDVCIRRFGRWRTRRKPARLGRNPKNGDPAAIPARRVVTFKPGDHLKGRVNAE